MDSLPLFHSWPLFDSATELGLDGPGGSETAQALFGGQVGELALSDSGFWSCDLMNDDRLSWTPAVHALFGLPRDEPVTRTFAASRYSGYSRRAMEILRAYAIDHRRGFTMDAVIRRDDGETRWMRLKAMPVIAAGKVVRLAGTKQDVTAAFDGPGWRRF